MFFYAGIDHTFIHLTSLIYYAVNTTPEVQFTYVFMGIILLQIDLLKTTLAKFYGNNPIDSSSISRVINKHHFGRLHKLLKDPLVAASIVHGGSLDEEKL